MGWNYHFVIRGEIMDNKTSKELIDQYARIDYERQKRTRSEEHTSELQSPLIT